MLPGSWAASLRHSMVLPLPTSPTTLMMPSPWPTAYSSAASISPRWPPACQYSVFGVMRKGASFRPKKSKYTEVQGKKARHVLVAAVGLHSAVQRGAVDAQKLGRLRQVAVGHVERGFDVGLFPLAQGDVEIEVGLGLQLLARHLDQRLAVAGEWNFLRVGLVGVELGFELLRADVHARVFGGQADRDVAQFAHVAGEVVVLPHLLRARVERERLALGLAGVEIAEVVE